MNQPVRVVLGPTYEPTMWDLGKRVRVAREAGEPLIFIQVGAPINGDALDVAILSGSLYLIGIKPRDGVWREFVPDDSKSDPTLTRTPKPRLPGSSWVTVGSGLALSSYRGLQLDWFLSGTPGATGTVVYANTAHELIRFFHQWNGDAGRHDARIAVLALIFVLCESLRFRTIENICARYIRPVGGMPADPVARPVLSITREMLNHVREWDKRSRARDPDVWTPSPGSPDPLFT